MSTLRRALAACAVVLPCAGLAACGSLAADPGPAPGLGASSSAWQPGGKAPAPALIGSAWDNFNHRGTVMWACRDLSSGDIVSTGLCHGLEKVDRHWPGMAVPPGYRGLPID